MKNCLLKIQHLETLLSQRGYFVWRGEAAQKGSLSKGRDQLSLVLGQILEKHLRKTDQFPTWKEAVDELRRLAENHHPIICETDDETEEVTWVARNGKLKDTSFSSIRDRLTRLRRKSR